MAGEIFIDGRKVAPQGLLNGNALITGADTTVDIFQLGRYQMQRYNIGANITNRLNFVVNAEGVQIPFGGAINTGSELGFGILTDSRVLGNFKIGTDPAFQARIVLTVPDVSELDVLYFGLKKNAAYTVVAKLTAASDLVSNTAGCMSNHAGINVLGVAGNATANLYTVKKGADASTGTATDTTVGVTDGKKVAIVVKCSAAGVVTVGYQVVAAGATCAPSADTMIAASTFSHTFTANDVVSPFLCVRGVEAGTTPPIMESLVVKYQ